MSNPKADELDRDEVIEWYKSKHGILLSPANKRKILHDQTEKRYCVLVAREDWQQWHGLDPEIFVNEKDWTDGVLVIGIRHKDYINIYQGPIKPLVLNKTRPTHRYQFHTREKESILVVNEIPDFSLEKVGKTDSPYELRVLMENLKENPEFRDDAKKLMKKYKV